jgi:thymidylate synthase
VNSRANKPSNSSDFSFELQTLDRQSRPIVLRKSVIDVLDQGADVVVRGKATRELVGRLTTLEQPLERYLFLPKRHNDVFAQFAETMWVLAGRNDIAWLSRYLPRAPDYSDDGQTWHGAYGPRLRRWAGDVDQLDKVRRLLSEDQASRRAVMVLFDPVQDFVDPKDVPCNNWLSWIVRDGKLHLSVAIRSNDAMWGFSGANAFEWSILQELMAYWLGFEVGGARYFATSFHLYDNHFNRARQIGEGFHGLTPYDFGIGRAAFQTRWNDFSAKLDQWFVLEELIRSKPDGPLFIHGRTEDPLLDSGLALVQVHWAHKQWGVEGALLPPGSPQPLSDHDANFDVLVDRLDLGIGNQSVEELVREIVDRFDTCWHRAEADVSRAERLSVSGLLAESAGRLVARLVADDKAVVARFVQSELSS